MAWCFSDEATAFTDSILDKMKNQTLDKDIIKAAKTLHISLDSN